MRILVVAAIATAAGCLSAQTTWTSFADRRGHAMARTATGGVVMFGGESVSAPGELLGDTVQLSTNNQGWTGVGAGPGEPPPTTGHAMAGAAPSGQPAYVMFGGITNTGPSSRTYKYNGNAWGDVTSGVSPLARSGHAMVANTATNTLLMFGGFDGTVTLNDLWEFTPGNDTWTPQTVGVAPVGRFGCSLAFHPGNGGTDGRMYMFGGSPFRNDLWEFNPFTSTWTQVFPAASPPGRRYAAMAYLVGSDLIVLFGGLSAGGVIQNDTWSYYRGANTWIQESPTLVPPARYEHAMSADNTGSNLVLLGGTNVLPGAGPGPVLDETWLWSSVTSNWIRPLPSPSARDGVAMAYDSQRNRHVVFGGRTAPGGTAIDETWEIDGLNWRERNPTTKPSPRSDAGMAFDAARNVTVLYGGRSTAGPDLGDTWEWNGNSWTPRFLAVNPPAASGVVPVFDSQRGTSWMAANDFAGKATMWSYAGVTWTPDQVAPGTGGFAWDSVRGKLVLLQLLGSTYEWDPTSGWRLATSGPAPSARYDQGMCFDAARQRVVVFGGYDMVTGLALGDTWTWNGAAWQPGAAGPAARSPYQQFVYDSARQVCVLFGGHGDGLTYFGDTWEWNGSAWNQVAAASPGPRYLGAGAFDSTRNRTVIAGGRDAAGFADSTIEFDGTTWVLSTAPGPFPVHSATAGFHATSNRLLLFGGVDQSSVYKNATWSWDGATWVQTTLPGPVTPRVTASLVNDGSGLLLCGGYNTLEGSIAQVWRHAATGWALLDAGKPPALLPYGAAYDARRDCVVLFFGVVGAAPATNETWEWDGSKWLKHFPAVAPSPRTRCKLTFDEARGRVVLYGGTDGINTFDDTWEWNGSNWTQRSPDAIPPGSSTHDLTFDKVRKVSVAFGSFGTWDYGPTRPATLTLYGSGCPTSASVPASAPLALKPLPWTGAWMGEPCEMEFTNAPPGLGLFLWGLSYTQWGPFPLPVSLALLGLGPAACNLRNSADLIEVMPVGVTRHVSFPMPSSPNALGLPLYGQAAFFDLGQPGFPVVTSDGAEMVIGQK